jgi:hypothetical protein
MENLIRSKFAERVVGLKSDDGLRDKSRDESLSMQSNYSAFRGLETLDANNVAARPNFRLSKTRAAALLIPHTLLSTYPLPHLVLLSWTSTQLLLLIHAGRVPFIPLLCLTFTIMTPTRPLIFTTRTTAFLTLR